MKSIDQFINPHGWRITSWEPPTNSESPIPSNGFVVCGTVLIGLVHHGSQSCGLSWLDGNGKLCSTPGLLYNADSGFLQRDHAVVSFGGSDVSCDVIISFEEEGGLIAEITGLKQDGNTGTFKAEAVPPPVDPVDPLEDGNTGTYKSQAVPPPCLS